MSANRTLIFFGRCRRHCEFALDPPYGHGRTILRTEGSFAQVRQDDGRNRRSKVVRLSPTASIPRGTSRYPHRQDIGLAGLPLTTIGCNVTIWPSICLFAKLPNVTLM